MMHFFKGEWVEASKTEKILKNISTMTIESLECDLQIQDVLDACETFSNKLLRDDELRKKLSVELTDEATLDEVASFCKKSFLIKKIEKELNGLKGYDLRKQSFKDEIFESYAALGTLVHITPSNSEGLSFLAAIEGLLALNTNFLKISHRDSNFTSLAMEELFKCDPSEKIKQKVGIFRISSSERESLGKLLSVADGVSVWGGESAISEIQKMTPPGARFIPWGHKISFAYVDKFSLNEQDVFNKLSSDIVLNEQQACSSPQVIYLETDNFEDCLKFSENLYSSLENESNKVPTVELGIQEQAEITNQVELARLESPMGIAKVFEAKDKSFRIIAEKNRGLRPSPLYRTILIKPLPSNKIISTLYPLRTYLQTVGLASSREYGSKLAKIFIAAGINRVTKVGEMLSSYEGEPHDGVYALSRFMRRVRAEIKDMEDIHSLEEFRLPVLKEEAGPIMDKSEFQKMSGERIDRAELFFRSGGSSGKTALSLFSYKDYHEQMQNAAEGLFAAGLNPKEDRVINLFFGGGLYGGFISFFTILEHLEAIQLPMAAHENLKMVGEAIIDNNVNTLVGMPSYIVQLLKENIDLFKKYGKLEKIFFGGEHFSKKQRVWIQNQLGIKVIRSAAYGSVDAGPLGFQCPACEGSVHHLLDSNQSLEILQIEADLPCIKGETGRLVFSSKNREVLDIKRYDLGDLGRWVEGDCPCGRKTPRFELQGRSGDIFRAGGTFINFQKIEIILRDKFDFSGEAQIIIKKNGDLDEVNLLIDSAFIQEQESEIRTHIMKKYHELHEVADLEKGLYFKVLLIDGENLERTSGSGKLIRVKDMRML
ncbi:MAG: hypothetical protein CME70_10260 [Halobacteriovorax sp.]|nr:hypothetical protein [Halobacteriovorax sp.]|tara:strand:- start:20901 stop:23378 length:2478 start_codon:yes stop_codon:yes gene_type:complete